MRLGQLARKLAVRQSELVDFLAQKSIHIENGGNTRIETAHLALLIENFAPGGLDLTAGEVAEPEAVEAQIEPELSPPVPAVASPPPPPDEPHEIEVIKAPKIELSGLKVLGKIDLPELKKKEPAAESAEIPEQPAGRPQRNFRDQPRKDRNQSRPLKNPIAAEREREAREAENKKREQAEREKEKKTLRYLKKMNTMQPTKAIRTVHETEDEPAVTAPPRPAPKNAWGRFMRWLNS
jgi:hypothetical protein